MEVKDVIAAPSVLPISDKPVTLNFSKGPIKIGASQFASYSYMCSILLLPFLGAASKPLSLGFSLGDGEGEDADEDAATAELTKGKA